MTLLLACLLLPMTVMGDPLPQDHCSGRELCLSERDRGIVLLLTTDELTNIRAYRPVCDDNWDKKDADVACTEAGFPRGALKATVRGLAPSGLADFVMDEVQCHGTEDRLLDCNYGERHDCGPQEAAGVVCDSATADEVDDARARLQDCYAPGVSYSPMDQIGDPTARSTALHCQQHCVSNPDCLQFSFSNTTKSCHLYSAASKVPDPYMAGGPRFCSSSRQPPEGLASCEVGPCLVGGNTSFEGNIFIDGRPACDDGWGETEAEVVCRQLDFGGTIRYTVASLFGLVTANYTSGRFDCRGDEESLAACSTVAGLSCDSGEAAGVVCDPRDRALVDRERACFTRGSAYRRTDSSTFSHPPVTTSSAAGCQALCGRTANCTHFTWSLQGGKCQLFQFIFDLTGNIGSGLLFSDCFIPEENKITNKDAVSGPLACALTTFACHLELGHTAVLSSNISNSDSLTLSGHRGPQGVLAAGILLMGQRPICDDGWGMAAAHVACRQLGFQRALEATVENCVGVDVFALDEVRCRGQESNLLDCEHSSTENCNSDEGAGVVCDARSKQDIDSEVATRAKECFASNVLFGPVLTTEMWDLPTVLDCQELCGRTLDCNTFSYRGASKECRLHRAGEVETGSRLSQHSQGMEIVEIQTKTDGGHAREGCIRGECVIKIKISDSDVSNWCQTGDLTGMKQGALDSHRNRSLGSCFKKTLTGSLFSMRVTQENLDGWGAEWIKVIFADNSTAHCPLGRYMDDSSSVSISCFLVDETGKYVPVTTWLITFYLQKLEAVLRIPRL
jgi:hypothetical protein